MNAIRNAMIVNILLISFVAEASAKTAKMRLFINGPGVTRNYSENQIQSNLVTDGYKTGGADGLVCGFEYTTSILENRMAGLLGVPDGTVNRRITVSCAIANSGWTAYLTQSCTTDAHYDIKDLDLRSKTTSLSIIVFCE